MKKPSLVSCRPEDLEDLARLVNSAYRGDSSRAGWTTEADYLDGQRTDPHTLAEELADPKKTILLLRQGRKLQGCVQLTRFEKGEGVGYYLGMLTVDPEAQAGGLGRTILEGAEMYAKERGASTMTLGVIFLRDSLMAWYERRGYRRTGKTAPFPYNDPRAGVPKRDDLHFIMFEKSL